MEIKRKNVLTYIRQHDIFNLTSRTYDTNKPDRPDEAKGAIKMNYNVVVRPVIGYDVKGKSVGSKKEAIALAKQWAKEQVDPDNNVYIEFYRSSDGQQGFINPDGAGITGKSWTELGN